MPEQHHFQAEVSRLLDIVAHALYTEKEIFLRELVSNAADACDRLRYEAIAKPELAAGDTELKISVSFDANARTLTVSDNGAGMSRDIPARGSCSRARKTKKTSTSSVSSA